LAAILTVAISTARLGSQQLSALDSRIYADAQLGSGLALLREALADPANPLKTQALLAPVAVQIAGRAVELAIVSEGGKIDVLRGDLKLIERLASNVGVPRDIVAQLLEDLEDRRGAGDDIGALDAVRLALVGPIGFEAVDDSFTRFGTDRIDPVFANDAVLRAIPDLSSTDASMIIAAPRAELGQYASLSRYFTSGSRRFSLVARLGDKPGQRVEKRLPIELTSSGGMIELDRPR
jgi:hypothetical protein